MYKLISNKEDTVNEMHIYIKNKRCFFELDDKEGYTQFNFPLTQDSFLDYVKNDKVLGFYYHSNEVNMNVKIVDEELLISISIKLLNKDVLFVSEVKFLDVTLGEEQATVEQFVYRFRNIFGKVYR